MVELFTAAEWHDSVGDIALRDVTLAQLAIRNVPVCPVVRPSGQRTVIVGGGAVLPPIDWSSSETPFGKALMPYAMSGGHILNAVSVVASGDFGYLKDYQYVSVRDARSYQRVRHYCPSARLVPCGAILAERPDLDYLTGLPGYGWLQTVRTSTNPIAIVDHGIVLSDEYKTIRVDTRPWSKRHWEKPPTYQHRNPAALLAAIAASNVVYATSLHLSILAMALGVPVVAWEPLGTKLRDYWERAGFPELVFRDADAKFRSTPFDPTYRTRFEEVRQSEQSLAVQHFDSIADLC